MCSCRSSIIDELAPESDTRMSRATTVAVEHRHPRGCRKLGGRVGDCPQRERLRGALRGPQGDRGARRPAGVGPRNCASPLPGNGTMVISSVSTSNLTGKPKLSGLSGTVIVKPDVAPARRAVTTTPSICPSSVERTRPVNAGPSCASSFAGPDRGSYANSAGRAGNRESVVRRNRRVRRRTRDLRVPHRLNKRWLHGSSLNEPTLQPENAAHLRAPLIFHTDTRGQR